MDLEQLKKNFEFAIEDYYEYLELNHSPDFTRKEVITGVFMYADPEIESMWHGYTAAMLQNKMFERGQI